MCTVSEPSIYVHSQGALYLCSQSWSPLFMRTVSEPFMLTVRALPVRMSIDRSTAQHCYIAASLRLLIASRWAKSSTLGHSHFFASLSPTSHPVPPLFLPPFVHYVNIYYSYICIQCVSRALQIVNNTLQYSFPHSDRLQQIDLHAISL